MYWTTPPSNIMVFFWVGSFTTDGVFVQNGYVYNGYSSYHWIPGSRPLAPNSWALFYTYALPGDIYSGDFVIPPSDWNPGNHIYFSIAVYPSKKAISFMFTDGSRCWISGGIVYCPAIVVQVIGVQINGRLHSSVFGILEGGVGTNVAYGDIHVDQIALWAQDLAIWQRNCGNAYVYDTGDENTPVSPSSAKIYIYTANVF